MVQLLRRGDGVAVALRRCAMGSLRGPTSPRIGLVCIDMKNAVKIFFHLLRCIERSWWCRTGGAVAAAQGLAGRRALLPCIRPSISMYPGRLHHRAYVLDGPCVVPLDLLWFLCASSARCGLEAAVNGRS
jgi:hypothetical protein